MSWTEAPALPRVRLTPTKGGTSQWGWLLHRDAERATIQLESVSDSELNAAFVAQVPTPDLSSSFACRLVTLVDGVGVFEILGELRGSLGTPPARVKMPAREGVVSFEDQTARCEVVDASARGAGLLLNAAIEPGTKLFLHVETGGNDVQLAAEVRYCRAQDGAEGFYRVGVQFEPVTREVSNLWTEFLAGNGLARKAA